MRAAAALLAALLVGCARPGAAVPDGGQEPGRPGRAEGRVAVVGSGPVNLRTALRGDGDGGGVYLEGPLEAELRRLGGARVEAWGERKGGVLRVEGYRLVSVDGAPAWLGVVEAAPGGGLQLRLADGRALRLRGATEPFRPGQKAWVQGPSTDSSAVTVQVYGIVSP